MSVPDRLALCVAGNTAQELFDTPTNEFCAIADMIKVYELIGHFGEPVGLTLRQIGSEKSRELIERHREKVANLAVALAERLELFGLEIAGLLA